MCRRRLRIETETLPAHSLQQKLGVNVITTQNKKPKRVKLPMRYLQEWLKSEPELVAPKKSK